MITNLWGVPVYIADHQYSEEIEEYLNIINNVRLYGINKVKHFLKNVDRLTIRFAQEMPDDIYATFHFADDNRTQAIIEINKKLWKELTPEQRLTIIFHELLHARYDTHGEEFIKMMRRFAKYLDLEPFDDAVEPDY
jgi:hypothetical protein